MTKRVVLNEDGNCIECGTPEEEHIYPSTGDCPANALLVPDWD